MEIHQYIILFKRWTWLIILGGVVAATVAFVVSKSQKPLYQATSVLLISEGLTTNADGGFQSLQLSERLALSYVIRLTNYEVLAESIASLGLNIDIDDLAEAIQVNPINNSQLISLSVEGYDPQIIAALANEIPQKFAERNAAMQLERFANSKANLETELTHISEDLAAAELLLIMEQNNGNEQLSIEQLNDNIVCLRETHSRLLQSYEDIRVAEAGSLNNLIIDEYARIPTVPISPRVVTNTLLAGIVGIMLAVGVVFLIEYLDDTIKDPASLEHLTGLSTIGVIVKNTVTVKNEKNSLVMMNQSRSPNAEAYRQVRTNVQYVGVGRELSTILVTSPNQGEGKSITAANLAITLAQASNKVILIDSDMRRPSLHHKFNIFNNTGLTDFLLSKENNSAFIQESGVENLQIITAGSLPPNPAELIHSERMQHIIDWLHETVDYIVLDSPPILAVTDAVLLSQLASTTVIVVEAGKTRQQSLLLGIQKIEAVGGHIAGILINKVSSRHSSYYYNYYAYQWDYHFDNNKITGRKNKLQAIETALLTFLSIL